MSNRRGGVALLDCGRRNVRRATASESSEKQCRAGWLGSGVFDRPQQGAITGTMLGARRLDPGHTVRSGMTNKLKDAQSKMKYTVVSLFSGGMGLDIGLDEAGVGCSNFKIGRSSGARLSDCSLGQF